MRLIAIDGSDRVYACHTTAMSGPSESDFDGNGNSSKSRLMFNLGEDRLVKQAQDMGCKHAYFVPLTSKHPYDPNTNIPKFIPSDWVDLRKELTQGSEQGTYLIGVPEEYAGLSGIQGTLVLRPNTGNEILLNYYQRLNETPETFPLHVGVETMSLDENRIITPQPPYPGRGLSDEQALCVAFSSLNPVTTIWGPPGTGKSVTIAGVLSHALSNGQRVLILATANQALDSLASKIHDIHTSGKDPLISKLINEKKITRYGFSEEHVKYPEISFTGREKYMRAHKKTPPTPAVSMANDAVTLCTLFRFLHLPPAEYDIVIIDEVGFVNIPIIYAAATIAAKKFVICGDPAQNVPIFDYKVHDVGTSIQALFKTDIFRRNKMRIRVGDAPDPRLCSLYTQYRMDDRIAEAVRLTNQYPRYVTAHNRKVSVADTVAVGCLPAPGEALVILDTGQLNPHSTSNYNQRHFELIKLFAGAALGRHNIGSVGIIAPYKKQSQAYWKWVKDSHIARCKVGTVHSFQGSEAPIVFYDTVVAESMGEKETSHFFTDDIKGGTTAINNLVVAVSRARAKLIVVMDVAYVQRTHSPGCYLHRLISHVGDCGNIIPAEIELSKMGRHLGDVEFDSAYFSKAPDVVRGDELIKTLASDLSVARQSVDIFSKEFNATFFIRLLEKLSPLCKRNGVIANFYFSHRLSAQDKLFIKKAIDAVPYFYSFKPVNWKHGDDSFIAIDNRVYYVSNVENECHILKGEFPATSTRFVFGAGEKKLQ